MFSTRILTIALAALVLLTACSRTAPQHPAPAAFLQQHNLAVAGEPERFEVEVPASWAVALGEYPEGLYWGLVNEYSKDVGLDLTPLKGQRVEVWRYPLEGGLPGEGEQSQFRYPSDAVLLVQQDQVVGAWLAFNKQGIGPSVKGRNLQAITGLAFEQWVEREGYFRDPGPNADLAAMTPAEVVNAFLVAINDGDERRANACLQPATLLRSLTMNLLPGRLYNPTFDDHNSLVKNVVRGRLISYRMGDPAREMALIAEAGALTHVQVAATLELVWRGEAFNTPDNLTTRFIYLERTGGGWKMDGLNTGP